MNNTAIILAGGIGSRMKISTPKQFLNINNKMIIEHTIEKFLKNKYIDNIIVVCQNEWIKKLKIRNLNIKIISGSTSRLESAYNGLKGCNIDTKNVLIHDAVRPFLENKLINTAIKKLEKYDATIPIISCSDSLINQNTMEYINRNDIKFIQTPQGFNYKIILDAYEKHINIKQKKKADFTDDFSLLLYYMPNTNYFFYEGDRMNMKITNKNDLENLNFKC
tara:strand:- start:26 stop:688 length:663 start_codon:yes stop_codon:yes gene_type:complete